MPHTPIPKRKDFGNVRTGSGAGDYKAALANWHDVHERHRPLPNISKEKPLSNIHKNRVKPLPVNPKEQVLEEIRTIGSGRSRHRQKAKFFRIPGTDEWGLKDSLAHNLQQHARFNKEIDPVIFPDKEIYRKGVNRTLPEYLSKLNRNPSEIAIDNAKENVEKEEQKPVIETPKAKSTNSEDPKVPNNVEPDPVKKVGYTEWTTDQDVDAKGTFTPLPELPPLELEEYPEYFRGMDQLSLEMRGLL
tara:strand:- start:746 stop:1483 length:738 start_codon:yes stop_codon:yes gene_type:complete